MRHRGLLSARGGDACALRMARHLAVVLGDQGVITDVPEVIRTYVAHHHVSERTAWADLGRLVDRCLLRQLQAAAPGYRARYRLCAPAAVIAERVPAPPPELASCVGLQTSPLTREGHPPPPPTRPRKSCPQASPGLRQGQSSDEQAQAADVIRRCAPRWAQQGHALAEDERDRLLPLVAIALRHVPPGEIVELLTGQVASARDLPGLLTWRLGRIVAGARRRTRVRADEAGARYHAMLASRASRLGPGPGALAEIKRARAMMTQRSATG
jgi:hypothetical protein